MNSFRFNRAGQPAKTPEAAPAPANHATSQDQGAARFEALGACSPHAIVELDPAGAVRYVNPAMQALFGLSPEAAAGRPLWELGWNTDAAQAVRTWFAEAIGGRAAPGFALRCTIGEGRRLDLQFDSRVLTQDGGPPAGLLTVITDRTSQQALAEQIAENERQLREFGTASADWLWSTDESDRFIFIAGRHDEICGIDASAALRQTRQELLARHAAEDQAVAPEKWRAHFADFAARRPYRNFRFAWRRPDGAVRTIASSAVPAFDERGAFVGYRGTSSDISSQVEVEAQALAASTRLVEAIESVSDIFALFDSSGALVLCNDAFRRFLPAGVVQEGRTLEAMFREAVTLHAFPDAQVDPEGFIATRLLHHRELPSEHEQVCAGGRWFRVRESATHDGGVLLWMTDISAAKQREAALRSAKEEAERANRAKSRFLAAASHDLRQPLHAASLFQQLLANRLREAGPLGLLSKLRDALTATEELLNKLLEVSKLEAGMVRPDIKTFPIGELLQRAAREHSAAATDRGLRLQLVNSSLQVRSDPVLLEGMLRHLVGNAIRHTASGKILIGLRRRAGGARLEIRDRGRGIPAGELEAIFEDFYQVGNPERDRNRGLGLGLGIVRRIGKLLNHPVGVRSTPGKGSVFWIEVPLDAATEAAAPEPLPATAEPTLDGISVLLIEDDPIQLEGLKLLFEDWGCRVLSAESLEQALANVRASHAAPDCAIADFRLRGGSTGIRALQTVAGDLGRALPGIILTGDVDYQRLKQAAASGYRLLHKPVDPAVLYRTVREVIIEVGGRL